MIFIIVIQVGFIVEDGWITIGEDKIGKFIINVSSDEATYIDNVKAFASGQPFKEGSTTAYGVESGTSFAAPFVTAAVGTISNKYEGLTTALERKEILLGAVRKNDDLTNYVSTGGTLDLSNLPEESIALGLSTKEDTPTYTNSKTITIQNAKEGQKYEAKINNENWTELDNQSIVLEDDGKYSIQIREKDSPLINDVTYYCVIDTKAPVLSIEPDLPSSQPKFTVEVSEEGSGIKDKNLEYSIVLEQDMGEIKTYKSVDLVSTQSGEEPETESIYTYQSNVNIDKTGSIYVYVKPVSDNAGNVSIADVAHVFGPYDVAQVASSPSPTVKPTEEVSPTPSPTATATPSPQPTSTPTPAPTSEPTSTPTSQPTIQPSTEPTVRPTSNPDTYRTPDPFDDSDDDESDSWNNGIISNAEKPDDSEDSSQTKTLDDYYAKAAEDKYDDVSSSNSGSSSYITETVPSSIPESSPKTGDKIILYLAILGVSAIAIIVLIYKKRKENKKMNNK